MFAGNGFEVAAYDCAERFRAARRDAVPAIVVTDLHMPGMTGLEMIRLLRDEGDRTPFILVTAFATPTIRSLARKYGVAGVVEKPFQPAQLLELVRAATP